MKRGRSSNGTGTFYKFNGRISFCNSLGARGDVCTASACACASGVRSGSDGARLDAGLVYSTSYYVPPGYSAVITGAIGTSDPVSNRERLLTLQGVVQTLKRHDVPIDFYVPGPGFLVDDTGTVWWSAPDGYNLDGYED